MPVHARGGLTVTAEMQAYSEDAEMTFEVYARGWLERQTKYAPGTIAFYRRSLETVFPEIGAIKLNRLRPIALENLSLIHI